MTETVELDGIVIVISIAMEIKTKNVTVWIQTDIFQWYLRRRKRELL